MTEERMKKVKATLANMNNKDLLTMYGNYISHFDPLNDNWAADYKLIETEILNRMTKDGER